MKLNARQLRRKKPTKEERATIPRQPIYIILEDVLDTYNVGAIFRLAEAVAEMEKSSLLREAFGDHIFNKFIENKVKEWDLYRIHVTDFELKRYLPML